jgi:hypothetical protein
LLRALLDITFSLKAVPKGVISFSSLPKLKTNRQLEIQVQISLRQEKKNHFSGFSSDHPNITLDNIEYYRGKKTLDME